MVLLTIERNIANYCIAHWLALVASQAANEIPYVCEDV